MHPSDVVSTKQLTLQLADSNSPSYTRTARNKTPVLYEGREDEITIGKGIVLQDGSDVAIIACGVMVSQSIEAAKALAADGIHAAVVDMHTLKPLDGALIDELVSKCGAIVTAEDHSIIGGLGGAVAEHMTSNILAPLERVGVQDRFGESGQADEMLNVMEISTPFIADAARRAIARKG
jgi:transketolase